MPLKIEPLAVFMEDYGGVQVDSMYLRATCTGVKSVTVDVELISAASRHAEIWTYLSGLLIWFSSSGILIHGSHTVMSSAKLTYLMGSASVGIGMSSM